MKRWKYCICKCESTSERKLQKIYYYDDLTVRDQASFCNIYISCNVPIYRKAKCDSSLVGVRGVIAGCLITNTWYVCHVILLGRCYFQSFWVEYKSKVLIECRNKVEQGKFFYAYFKRNILQYEIPIFF